MSYVKGLMFPQTSGVILTRFPGFKALVLLHHTAQKMKFSLRISSVNVTKSLMENFIFCAVLNS